MATDPGIKKTRKRQKKSAPPQLEETKDLTRKRSRETPVTLTFKVSPEYHKEFKKYAINNDFMSMQSFFEACFEFYKDNH